MTERVVMSSDDMRRAMTRIAHEILERNKGAEDLVLVGIETRGVCMARRLAANIERFENLPVAVGTIDPTGYRDDVRRAGERPECASDIPVDIQHRPVVLVDDVLYTGRTVRAALDALMDIGRAARIQLAALVDRGHRELPIRPDFVGKNIPTASEERVSVRFMEVDGEDSTIIVRTDIAERIVAQPVRVERQAS
jgi:pyrimidine operon attenuation protein/uracil phosphoribosyltransferase